MFHLGDALNNYEGSPWNAHAVYGRLASVFRKHVPHLQRMNPDDIQRVGFVPGNHEIALDDGTLGDLQPYVFHKEKRTYNGYRVGAYGGGFAFVYRGAWEQVENRRFRIDPHEMLKAFDLETLDVLLLHQLEHSETLSLRDAIKELQPKLVLIGHEHTHGIDTKTKPVIVNCGPIYPIAPDNHKNHGRSSYTIVTFTGDDLLVKQYYFGPNQHFKYSEPRSDLELKVHLPHRWMEF